MDPSSFGGNSTQQEYLLGGEVSPHSLTGLFVLYLDSYLLFRSVYGVNSSTPSTPFQDYGLGQVQLQKFCGLQRLTPLARRALDYKSTNVE